MLSFLRCRRFSTICDLRTVYNINLYKNDKRLCNTDIKKENEIVTSGLVKALGKFRELEKTGGKAPQDDLPVKEEKGFLYLLRHSEFVRMGDPAGAVVIGKIFQVVNTDLYIDFGGKFYCVCRRPKKDAEKYVRNSTVKLRLNELELCARFLGAVEDLTLTEASGTLLELIWTPYNSKKES